MIKIYCGGIGSGKSVSATKDITEVKKDKIFVNYKLFNLKNYERLRYDHIIKDNKINWKFWKDLQKQKINYHIIIDEIHNLMHSRRSMSRNNVMISAWISQIRKILSGNEKYHLLCISQETDRIDVSIRDLVNEIVYHKKFIDKRFKIPTLIRENGRLKEKLIHPVWIMQYFFLGTRCLKNYETFREMGIKTYHGKKPYFANKYFRYYDSYDLVEMGDETFL